jgi:hypothetical protein
MWCWRREKRWVRWFYNGTIVNDSRAEQTIVNDSRVEQS